MIASYDALDHERATHVFALHDIPNLEDYRLSDNLSSNEISERVLNITSEVLSLEQQPSLDMDLRKDLNADSLDLLTLFMTLEDEFGGSIPEEEAGKISTLRDIVEYVNGRLAAEQPEC